MGYKMAVPKKLRPVTIIKNEERPEDMISLGAEAESNPA